MSYPTMKQVEEADIIQLCRWSRFLKSPGWSAVGQDYFHERLQEETKIMNRILERQKELGGWTPEISKRIGWD